MHAETGAFNDTPIAEGSKVFVTAKSPRRESARGRSNRAPASLASFLLLVTYAFTNCRASADLWRTRAVYRVLPLSSSNVRMVVIKVTLPQFGRVPRRGVESD
jgi:hypothetical protein